MQSITEFITNDQRIVKGNIDFPTTLLSNNPFEQELEIFVPRAKASRQYEENDLVQSMKINYSYLKDESRKKKELLLAIKDLKKDRDNKFLLNNLGIVYLRYSEFDRAKKSFMRALEIDSKFLLAKQNLANTYISLEDYSSAKLIYEEILESDNNDSHALLSIGNILLKSNDFKGAKKFYDKVWRAHKRDVDAGNKLALIYILEGEIRKAISIFRKCILIDQNNPNLYNNLGIAHLITYQEKKAIIAFKSAIKVSPIYTPAIINLVRIYESRRKYKTAIVLLEESLTNNDDIYLIELLSRMNIAIKNESTALKLLLNVIENKKHKIPSQKEYARLLNNIGVIYFQLDNFSMAENFYIKSLQTFEFNIKLPLTNLIDLYFEIKKLDRAKQLLDLYLEKFPSDKDHNYLMAKYLFHLNEIEEAVNLLKVYLSLEKPNINAFHLMSFILSEYYYDYPNAIKYLEEGFKIYGEDELLLNNLIYNNLMYDKINKAEELLRKLESADDTTYITATNGLYYLKLGEVEKARKLYNEAAHNCKKSILKNEMIQKKELELAKYFLKNGNKRKAVDSLKKHFLKHKIESIYKIQALELLDDISNSD